jgi:hypothetical protein
MPPPEGQSTFPVLQPLSTAEIMRDSALFLEAPTVLRPRPPSPRRRLGASRRILPHFRNTIVMRMCAFVDDHADGHHLLKALRRKRVRV